MYIDGVHIEVKKFIKAPAEQSTSYDYLIAVVSYLVPRRQECIAYPIERYNDVTTCIRPSQSGDLPDFVRNGCVMPDDDPALGTTVRLATDDECTGNVATYLLKQIRNFPQQSI